MTSGLAVLPEIPVRALPGTGKMGGSQNEAVHILVMLYCSTSAAAGSSDFTRKCRAIAQGLHEVFLE